MNNEPVAWMGIRRHGETRVSVEKLANDDIPLYTQDQLEEARKLGMQQERAMWNLSASTQEIMDTHPVKELNDGGEPVKNATYWKRQYNLMATQNDNLKSGLYHANEQIKYLESHPVKEQDTDCQYCKQGCIRCDARKQLTDEEILEIILKYESASGNNDTYDVLDCIREVLRKAQE